VGLNFLENDMRTFLAIFFPSMDFFTIGRPISAVFCFVLQITLIGWLPAALWAISAVGGYKTAKQIKKLSKAMAG
jgi:uncharacterized membrane protein YqaE (UPF0057 family)